MSELIIIGYDGHGTAQRAFEQVQALQADRPGAWWQARRPPACCGRS